MRESVKMDWVLICVRLRDCWNVSKAGESWIRHCSVCGDLKVAIKEG